MVKTLVERVSSPKPDVTIFKISGTLGYHENEVLTKFFSECGRKSITKLVMDFSGLSSLGGGCAKIIRKFGDEGHIRICIAGASQFVRKYLDGDTEGGIVFAPDVARAVDLVDEFVSTAAPQKASEPAAPADPAEPDEPADALDAGIEEILSDAPVAAADKPKRPSTAAKKPAATPAAAASASLRKGASGGNGGARPSAESLAVSVEEPLAEGPASDDDAVDAPALEVGAEAPARASAGQGRSDSEGRDLHRKLVQYRSLLSLTSDFNRIRDKHKLLDAFLLTTIAQAGVESAAFLEFKAQDFVAVCWKGFETADPTALRIASDEIDLDAWRGNLKIALLEESPVTKEAVDRLTTWGMPYIAPFVVHEQFRGLVLLGRPIRSEFDQSSWDYLSTLINQAAIAYENTQRFEEETERTLGLVQTMVSLIEENTITRGSTDLVVNYTFAVAQRMHYPEEYLRDLAYGAVLRDIGMIKISDLIVRSPRELVKEEWELIKRHPSDGGEMLRKMNFSEHTVEIVKTHHERFNGEGYPEGTQAQQIPLGARIVSVVESYVAMIQDRPTRPALSAEEALNTLKENWGIRYDPDVINEFAAIVEDEIRTGHAVKHPGSELLHFS